MKSRAKKRLGQHFLRDARILDRLIRLVDPASTDTFLEVGAGYGALSERLAPRVARLIAVELDRDCVSALQISLARFPSATVAGGGYPELEYPGPGIPLPESRPVSQSDRELAV